MLRPLLVGVDYTITNHQKKIKMTDYRVTLKSNIQNVELNKKNVKIDCHNNKAGQSVVTTLNQNIAIFGGNSYDINKGVTAKDFKVKFNSKDAAQEFYDNLKSIMNNNSIPTEPPQQSGLQNLMSGLKNTVNTVFDGATGETPEDTTPTAPTTPEDTSSSKMPLIIGGAVLLVVIIGLVIWKMKK